MTLCRSAAASLAAFALPVLGSLVIASNAALARDIVAERDMNRYCEGRAAQKFHVNPRDILTLPMERDGNGHVVYGQFPQDGPDISTFECHFGGKGKWKRVRLTTDARQTSQAGDDVVAESDMQRYCQGEASAAFGERPQDILTLPLERDPGGYVVYGQFPPEGRQVTTFECHFSNRGVFETVFES